MDAPEKQETEERQPTARDASYWAAPVSELKVGELPPEALNRNVEGRRPHSPIQGFGKLWQKTYKTTIGDAATPQEVISTWKQKFPSFWPPGNFYYGAITGIAPGEVAVLNMSMPGRLKLSTGVLVLYADDESFTLMSPEGHMFAGWITFSAFADAAGATTVQAQVLVRASDPIYEIGFALGGSRKEDRFWHATLQNLASHFGIGEAEVDMQAVCVDKKRQWRNAKNITKNSAIRSGLYGMGAPFRWMAKPFRRSKPHATE